MPRFIVTGNYTQSAVQGMIAAPSDRSAASRALVEAAGGTMEAWYPTTGPTDFPIVVNTDDITGLISALMVAGASGAVNNLQTQHAFTPDELQAAQVTAGTIASSYKAPG